jgi:type 1 glutamine amidotransferase
MGTPEITGLENKQILVFTKTSGFRHESIPDGKIALQRLAEKNHFAVDTTENADIFTRENLAKYDAIVFLNTSGNVLNDEQQKAFVEYIGQGGGYVGIHAASDTEWDWPWYGKLVGAYFDDHPELQEATIRVTNQEHPSTVHLPELWTRFDEWYNFKSNPRNQVNVLAEVDESTYEGGTMNGDHPIAWYHEYEGGRAWYTALGHTKESYQEPKFLEHILGGIIYATGLNP